MLKKTALIVLVFLIARQGVMAQQEAGHWSSGVHFSPIFRSHFALLPSSEAVSVEVVAADTAAFLRFLSQNMSEAKPTVQRYGSSIFSINPIEKTQVLQLVESGTISAIEMTRHPREETGLNGLDRSLNRVRLLQREWPQLNGEGLTASIKENRFDTTDIDFKGRHLISAYSSSALAQHATIMATILGGAGNSGPTAEGVSRGARLSSANFANLLPEADDYFFGQNISVQNHSYGTGIENYYGIETRAYDEQCQAFPELLHVFSAGNFGDQTPDLGKYAGIAGFANLTGQFKMSKNTLSVGATDSMGNVVPLSSRGPAFDGRIKPEVVAFGLGGSSGAAALVSGIALPMQQAYASQHAGQLPASALLKAILINTAHDVGSPQVDFESGFGSVDAASAVRTILDQRFLTDAVQQDEVFQMPVSIPPGTASVKITLAWNDPAAEVNSPKALTNDLDLELEQAATAQTWLPWVLNTFPHADSLRLTAERGRDSLNNVEQISLESPATGNYWVRVKGTDVAAGPQNFALTWQLDSLDKFQWVFPTKIDYLLPGQANLLRWESTLSSPTGGLSFRYIGDDWQPVATGADLAAGNFSWPTPERHGLAQLRCEAGPTVFVSDTFTVAAPLRPKVGFDCPDSLMFFWGKMEGASTYQVFQLGSRYLELLAETADTFFVHDAAGKSVLHYAVASVIAGKTGPLSYTFDYTKQGVGCYLKNFLFQSQQGNSAFFTAALGTTYGLEAVLLQKGKNGSFETEQTISPVDSLDLTFEGAPLAQGANFFRLKLLLQNGGEVFSQTETVYFLENDDYLLFPNPVAAGKPVLLLSKNQLPGTYRLLDMQGRTIAEESFDLVATEVSTQGLPSGCYALQITDENGQRKSKLLVVK